RRLLFPSGITLGFFLPSIHFAFFKARRDSRKPSSKRIAPFPSPTLPYSFRNRGTKFLLWKEAHFTRSFLRIPKGSFVGLAGPSGCGKSSLIKAICKLEDYQGEIWLEEQNLRDLSRTELTKCIALVPQGPFLIAGTIEENICYDLKEKPSEQEILEAVEKACLKEWIESLPLGLQTPIFEGGGNLSEGQRQRLAIGRIFLRQPDILIFG
ncbi:MAG: ATP-binding cassette domain-containing protein, partial [Allobaculum sp.]|nr:ATP-binding cassette domain-containing protein [Allobaculum sp.]